MGKSYFFFQSKHQFDDKDEKMGRNRNRKKWWKNKKQEKQETKVTAVKKQFGFAESSKTWDDDDCDFSTTKWTAPATNHYQQKKQDVVDPDRVISSDQGFLEIHHSDAWGTVLVPVDDPKAHKVTLNELSGIKLIDDFPKIPRKLWSMWVKLARYLCEKQSEIRGNKTDSKKPILSKSWNCEIRAFDYFHHLDGQKCKIEDPEKVLGPGVKYGGIDCEYTSSVESKISSSASSFSDLEVSVLLCRKADNLRQWKILVPKQQVSHSSVRAETKDTIDIETGEVHNVFPPLGWYHAGSSHSHNNFSPFYSHTDDESELGVPGLHIVLGNIRPTAKTHDAKASVVMRRLRKHVELSDVVEDGIDEDVTFHPKALENISTFSPTTTTVWTPSKAWATKTEDTPALASASGDTCKSNDDRCLDETPRSSVSAEDLDNMDNVEWWQRLCAFRDGFQDPGRCSEKKSQPMDPRQDPDELAYGWC